MLTKDQIINYQENGFVVPDFHLPEDDLLEIEKKHFKLILQNRHPQKL